MFTFLRRCLGFLIIFILVCSFGEIKGEDKKEPKIPFKLTEPIIFNILLKDKDDNDIEAKITFQEYIPPLELNQSFGLEWKDLDFSTVEQAYLGFELWQTEGQYFSLHHGTAKQDMEEIYLKEYPKRLKEVLKEREENPLSKNCTIYYSKCMIETAGKKHVLTKNMLGSEKQKIIGVEIYYYIGNKWKYSDQFEEDFPHSSFEFFLAYEEKNTSEFLDWLKEQQTKAEMEKDKEQIKADNKEEPKIPFNLTEPIIFNILLKDKDDNDIEAKIAFQEYVPPLKLSINQTFGLEWKDLDFSTVEQVYLGFKLWQTEGQYFSLHHGTAKQDMEEIYLKEYPNRLKEILKERKKNPLSVNYTIYYSKCMIETTGKKYVLTKRMLGSEKPKIIGVVIYYYVENKWRDSDQFEEDFPHSSFKFFVAYEGKNTSEFLDWLKEQQTKAGSKSEAESEKNKDS